MNALREMTLVELKLLLREPLSVIFVLVLPVAVLVILNGIFGAAPEEFYDGLGAVDFYTSAYVALVVATIGVLAVPVQLAGYREKGVLRRLRASAVPMTTVLGAQVAMAVITAAAASAVLVSLSILVYGATPPADWLGVGAGFLLVTVTFATIGVTLGLLLPTARAAQGLGVLLFFIMLNLGGAGPPPDLLPDAMATARSFMPLTPATDVLRDPWLLGAWNPAAAAAMAALLLTSGTIALMALRRDTTRA